MTATIIAFPTMAERDDLEFGRTGSSRYIRACDEGRALWDCALVADRPVGLKDRVSAFVLKVEDLGRTRPEVLGDLVMMRDGSGIELALLARMLPGWVC